KMPLTANGKLDRKALPAPEYRSKEEYRAPVTPAERIVCEVMAETLGLERVGLDDNFFQMGGDSIVSIQLVSRLRKRGLVITPRDVFLSQTAEGLASVTEALVERESEEQAVGKMELTPVMRWLEEMKGPMKRFSQTMLLQVPVGLGE